LFTCSFRLNKASCLSSHLSPRASAELRLLNKRNIPAPCLAWLCFALLRFALLCFLPLDYPFHPPFFSLFHLAPLVFLPISQLHCQLYRLRTSSHICCSSSFLSSPDIRPDQPDHSHYTLASSFNNKCPRALILKDGWEEKVFSLSLFSSYTHININIDI
jgi:hypothetical protein